MVKKEKKQ